MDLKAEDTTVTIDFKKGLKTSPKYKTDVKASYLGGSHGPARYLYARNSAGRLLELHSNSTRSLHHMAGQGSAKQWQNGPSTSEVDAVTRGGKLFNLLWYLKGNKNMQHKAQLCKVLGLRSPGPA